MSWTTKCQTKNRRIDQEDKTFLCASSHYISCSFIRTERLTVGPQTQAVEVRCVRRRNLIINPSCDPLRPTGSKWAGDSVTSEDWQVFRNLTSTTSTIVTHPASQWSCEGCHSNSLQSMWLWLPHLIIVLTRELPLIYAGLFCRFKALEREKKGLDFYFLNIFIKELSCNKSLLEGIGLILWLLPSDDAAKVATWKQQSQSAFHASHDSLW